MQTHVAAGSVLKGDLHSSQCQGSVFLWAAKGADLLLVHGGPCPLRPQPSGAFSYQAPHYAQVVSCLGPRHRAPQKPMLFHQCLSHTFKSEVRLQHSAASPTLLLECFLLSCLVTEAFKSICCSYLFT